MQMTSQQLATVLGRAEQRWFTGARRRRLDDSDPDEKSSGPQYVGSLDEAKAAADAWLAERCAR